MSVVTPDLWRLVEGRPEIDPDDLADAIAALAVEDCPDYRSRLLIHDCTQALREYWGTERWEAWLEECSQRKRIEAIVREEFDRPGFPSIARRLMDKTEPDTIRAYLRELGTTLHKSISLQIGGSVSLLLPGYLERRTEDVDVVNEVPQELRSQHALLNELEKRYGLHLAHFQSHYLPRGWENRLHSVEPFGRLQVYLVDVYDVFLSKLFSARTKDRDDLRLLLPQLDKETIIRKLREHTASLQADVKLLQHAQQNWYILFGEALPS